MILNSAIRVTVQYMNNATWTSLPLQNFFKWAHAVCNN